MNVIYRALAGLLLFSLAPSAWGQQNFDNVEIEIVHVAEDIYMLMGRGGNIGVSVGEDGVFMIDDQFAPLTEKILAAVATLSDQPVQFVLNTHFHGDHVGGNENMGEAGAIIVAHENVRARMSMEQYRAATGNTRPPSPPGALPVVTFDEGISFHWNGDHIRVYHDWTRGHAHTDGDAIVHFTNANVFHMGDTFFNGGYPFVDVDSGGDVRGIIGVADRVLALSDENTMIIPGHGMLSSREGLQTYRDMLVDVVTSVQQSIAAGNPLETIVGEGHSSEYDAEWGGGFISPEALVRAIYYSIMRDR